MRHYYDNELRDFRVGDRVETHPCTDCWMRGARFGVVTKVGREYVSVQLDALKSVVRFSPKLLAVLE